MTIFGPDVSSFQTGLDLSKVPAVSYVIAKTSEGTYYTDAAYQGFRSQASHLNKPFVWYHFLSTEPAAAQVAHTLASVGDPSLPGMLDCEPAGGHAPTWAEIQAYATAARAAGLNLRLIYLPHWYWQEIGSPDLTGLGLGLVASGYEGPTAYPGDADSGWFAYGGVVPLIWQYTDALPAAGFNLDFNAFRGTPSALEAFLKPTSSPSGPSQGDDNMPAFATGEVNRGAGAETIICVPPANYGSAGWGNVWFSLGAAYGEAHVEVSVYTHGAGWAHLSTNLLVPDSGDRVNPAGGPLPIAVQKVAIKRVAGTEDVPVGWLVEATAR